MKRLFTSILICSLLVTLAGCSSMAAVQATDSLSIMKEVNDSNIVHQDPLCRLWYQIDTSGFADSDEDGTGDLQGILQRLDYLSDGDPETSDEDLNMTGLFLNELIQTSSFNAITDYYTINPSYGEASDLARLCEKASEKGMDVMINLNLSTISAESSIFTELTEKAEELDKDADVGDIDFQYAGAFYLDTSDEEKNMYPLGDSGFYYRGEADASIPLINQDDPAWRQLISNVVSYYMNLGVKGFYIPDVSGIFPDNQKKNTEFLSWFNRLVKDRDPYAVIAAGSLSYSDSLDDLGIYVAQNDFSGADGYISKAVTGAIDAQQLAEVLKKQNTSASYFLSEGDSSMDLLKSATRIPDLKMALAILVLMSGQVFISAGDEIGLPRSEVSMVSQALDSQETEENIHLTFGSYAQQCKDGNSVLNFLMQAIRLRNSYSAVSQGQTAILDSLTTPSLLVVEKKTDESSVVIVMNLTDEVSSMDTDSILIHDLPAELGGILVTGEDPVTLEDGVLTLPAHSVAVLK